MVFSLHPSRSRTMPSIVGRISPAPLFFASGDIERTAGGSGGERGEGRRACVLQLGAVCRYSRKCCLMTTISIRELCFPAAFRAARLYPASRLAVNWTVAGRKIGNLDDGIIDRHFERSHTLISISSPGSDQMLLLKAEIFSTCTCFLRP